MVSFISFSFDRKRGGASMRRWKNWALSVAGRGLPTFGQAQAASGKLQEGAERA
jgi:hypothetical protein